MTEISIEALTGRDISELDKGGMPKPGKAHFLVGDYIDEGDNFTIISEMVGHEDESEVGKQCRHWFQKGGGGAARAILFAQATGIVTRDWLAKEQARGRKTLEIPYEASISRSFLGTLEENEYEKDGKTKKSVKIAFDFKSPTSPAAADYPVNKEYVNNLTLPTAPKGDALGQAMRDTMKAGEATVRTAQLDGLRKTGGVPKEKLPVVTEELDDDIPF